MPKKKIGAAERNVENILLEIRKRRERVLKQRDRARKKVKAPLSEAEIILWESEKR